LRLIKSPAFYRRLNDAFVHAFERVGNRDGSNGCATRVRHLEASAEKWGIGKGTGRIVDDDDLGFNAGERERDAHGILALMAAWSDFHRNLKASASDLVASPALHAVGNRDNDLGNRGQGRQRCQRIVEHRTAAKFYERLRFTRAEPGTAARCDDDGRGLH
jgi:hypothetical protein